jgi:hypothetical protein
MSALGETGDQISTINRSVGTVTSIVQEIGTWATGAKVTARYMLENYLKNKSKGV